MYQGCLLPLTEESDAETGDPAHSQIEKLELLKILTSSGQHDDARDIGGAR